METPEKLYISNYGSEIRYNWHPERLAVKDIEYTRTDALIDKVINFLNYKLDDVVNVRVPGTIIPHHVAKQEVIDELRNHMKGQ